MSQVKEIDVDALDIHGPEIGHGAFGVAKLATLKATNVKVVVKTLAESANTKAAVRAHACGVLRARWWLDTCPRPAWWPLQRNEFMHELGVQSRLARHPNVVELLGA